MSYVAARTAGPENGPLVFTFHGTGGDETQFHGIASQLIRDSTVVSPRGDVLEAGMNRYFRRTGEGIYDMDDLWARTEAMASFLNAEKAAAAHSHVLAMGYSNGANILAAVAMKYPDIFDEMILMHPLIPWQPEPQPALAGRRALITAGRHDPICPADMTEALGNYLRDQDIDLTFAWHPGGHEIRQDEIDAIQNFIADG